MEFFDEEVYYYPQGFFNDHYTHIEEWRKEYREEVALSLLTGEGDLKEFLAWFAFKTTARQIAQEIGIEV